MFHFVNSSTFMNYCSGRVNSTCTPGSNWTWVMFKIWLWPQTNSMTRLWIRIWYRSQVLEPSPHGVFLVVILIRLVGIGRGPLTLMVSPPRALIAFARLQISAHALSTAFGLWAEMVIRMLDSSTCCSATLPSLSAIFEMNLSKAEKCTCLNSFEHLKTFVEWTRFVELKFQAYESQINTNKHTSIKSNTSYYFWFFLWFGRNINKLWTGSRYEQVEQGLFFFMLRSQYCDSVKKMVKAKLNRAEQIRLFGSIEKTPWRDVFFTQEQTEDF